MLSDRELVADLEKLKTIVARMLAPESPFAIETTRINGVDLRVFSKVPHNLGAVYELGREAADKTFLVYQEERHSFAETLAMARRLARALREQYAVGKGDRVAICARNTPEWCLAYMATTMLGAIVTPFNSWSTARELKFLVEDSGSKLVFADPPRLKLLGESVRALDVIIIKPEAGCDLPETRQLLARFAPLDDAELRAIDVGPEDDATLMYTSGSTGAPKGVLSSHRAVISALYTWKFVREVSETMYPELVEENPPWQPAILANVPLFHVTGSHAPVPDQFHFAAQVRDDVQMGPGSRLGVDRTGAHFNFPRRAHHDLGNHGLGKIRIHRFKQFARGCKAVARRGRRNIWR